MAIFWEHFRGPNQFFFKIDPEYQKMYKIPTRRVPMSKVLISI